MLTCRAENVKRDFYAYNTFLLKFSVQIFQLIDLKSILKEVMCTFNPALYLAF